MAYTHQHNAMCLHCVFESPISKDISVAVSDQNCLPHEKVEHDKRHIKSDILHRLINIKTSEMCHFPNSGYNLYGVYFYLLCLLYDYVHVVFNVTWNVHETTKCVLF